MFFLSNRLSSFKIFEIFLCKLNFPKCNINPKQDYYDIINIFKKALNKISMSFIQSRSWSTISSKQECHQAIEAFLAFLSYYMNTRNLKRSKSLPSFPISIRNKMCDHFNIKERISCISVDDIDFDS